MSEAQAVDAAVEQVTQEVKDVKLENGTAPGAVNGTANKAEGAISFKVIHVLILIIIKAGPRFCYLQWTMNE